jgi:Fic family protein
MYFWILEYENTHPWLRFSLRIDPADHRLWLRLGEVASKCEHLSGAPLRPEVAVELNRVFLTKGVLATTAIEGNTLSEEQVRQQVEGILELPPSQEYLQQEVKNIIDVCNEEVQAQIDPATESPSLCAEMIRRYNERVLQNLTVDEGVVPGELRTHSVVVGNVYRGAPAPDCGYLLDRLCEWLEGPDFVAPEKDLQVPYALIKAVVAHIYLAWIHPFGDGNGRTARLVEFHILFSSGVPLPAAHLLSDHYNRTRTQYYRELAHASGSGGDLMPFLRYAVQGFLDGIRGQISEVRSHQMGVAWENYVHERFKDKKTSPTQKRRRDLVLELTGHGWVPVAKIEDLSPTVARFYAAAGDRMLQRDLNAIAKMGLIDRIHGKVRARKYIIQAFLPARVQAEQAKA